MNEVMAGVKGSENKMYPRGYNSSVDRKYIACCENRNENIEVLPDGYRFRKPCAEDGADIWHLVKDTGILDLNSVYSYLMLCRFFSDTCVVAEYDGKIVGFVSAFRPPECREVIFVWQVAVAESQRGKGVGIALLKELLKREACAGVRFLEVTVTPSNIPSRSLFRKLARETGACCEVSEFFPVRLFPGGKHEAELMYRIGPFLK